MCYTGFKYPKNVQRLGLSLESFRKGRVFVKKCIVAPDSFKGTLSAAEAAKIMAECIKKHFPHCNVVTLPIADGGEGTTDCFLAAIPQAELVPVTVKGPFLDYVGAYYVRFGDTAVIELAQAAGITLTEGRLDPMKASTYGVGQMILHAVNQGCRNISVALGGSCTNDGGVGIAAALGAKFYDNEGIEFLPTGGTLKQIVRYHDSACREVLKDCNITVLCDIENPLCGENGAAYVFAPQKGADEEMVRELDEGLRHLASLITYQRGMDVSTLPGAGAAGGCGGGIVAFLGGTLCSGIQMVLELMRFDERIRNADLIFTGEGKLDSQSAGGKAVSGIAAYAVQQKIPVVAVAGIVEEGAELLYERGVAAMFSITSKPEPFDEAKLHTRQNLRNTMDNILRLYSFGRK